MDYIKEALKTSNEDFDAIRARFNDDRVIKLLHSCMGLSTEVGEIMDILKRYLIYGKPIDWVNLEEEHGDLFWYMAIGADAGPFTFESAQEKNIAKLRLRYPNKFTEHDALNRDLDKERKILET